jgi:hypothetical protein
MIWYNGGCITIYFFCLFYIIIELSIGLYFLNRPFPIILCLWSLDLLRISRSWFIHWFVDFRIRITIVITVPGILGDILNSVRLAGLKGTISFVPFACVRIYILASCYWSCISPPPLWRIPHIHWEVDVVTIEGAAFWLFRLISRF